jgi:hypothetical protein
LVYWGLVEGSRDSIREGTQTGAMIARSILADNSCGEGCAAARKHDCDERDGCRWRIVDGRRSDELSEGA